MSRSFARPFIRTAVSRGGHARRVRAVRRSHGPTKRKRNGNLQKACHLRDNGIVGHLGFGSGVSGVVATAPVVAPVLVNTLHFVHGCRVRTPGG